MLFLHHLSFRLSSAALLAGLPLALLRLARS